LSEPGNIIEGKYEVLFKLSEGGMGEVYKVRHLLLDGVFVIKKIRAQLHADENLQRRFLREAQTAIRLKHPNIAEIHDFFISEEGTAHLVMEFIDGVTFKEILSRSGPPSLGLTLELARQSLGALSFLHTEGYLHRDISSDNLMLTRSFDGRPLVKVLDLGLAKSLTGGVELTSRGMFLGKARYSAPEQLSGKSDLGPSADLYAFGVTLYEMLTGCYPVEGEDFPALFAGHLLRPPRDFAETDPGGRVPPKLRQIVLKTLEKQVERRVSSAAELLDLLLTVDCPRWLPEEADAFFEPPMTAHQRESRTPGRPTGATIVLPRKAEPARPNEESVSRVSEVPTQVHTDHDRSGVAPTPRRPWRWRVMAAGFLVLFLGALGWWSGLGPEIPAESEAQKVYRRGVEARERKDWEEARNSLREAVVLDPQEKLELVWDDAAWRGRPYLPYFFLGLVLTESVGCELALDAFKESMDQAVVQQTVHGAKLEQQWAQCDEALESRLNRMRKVLSDAGPLVAGLEAALSASSFESTWQRSPELRAKTESALADWKELETSFLAAQGRRDYTEFRRLEEKVAESLESLDSLAEQVGEAP